MLYGCPLVVSQTFGQYRSSMLSLVPTNPFILHLSDWAHSKHLQLIWIKLSQRYPRTVWCLIGRTVQNGKMRHKFHTVPFWTYLWIAFTGPVAVLLAKNYNESFELGLSHKGNKTLRKAFNCDHYNGVHLFTFKMAHKLWLNMSTLSNDSLR